MPELDLAALFREDGHELIKAGGEWKVLCPFHKEKTPSCTIKPNGPDSFYYCFGCNATGDAVEYLHRHRGMEKKDALQLRDEVEGRPGVTGRPEKGPDANSSRSREKKPREFLAQLPDEFEARYVYRTAKGAVAFVIHRYQIKGNKVFGQYTRAKKDGTKGWLKGLPAPYDSNRPLYGLTDLQQADPKLQVMVVEGEKCRDAVTSISKKRICVSWAGGTSSWKRTDWTPLHGRHVLLVADGDDVGHKCMGQIAKHLAPHCPEILLVLPPGNSGQDIADEIATRPKSVAKWLKKHAVPFEAKSDKAPPESEKIPAAAGSESDKAPPREGPGVAVLKAFGSNEYFKILGNVDALVVVKLQTNQVLMLSRQAICTPQQLIAIAPDPSWWIQVMQCDGISRAVAMTAGAGLLRLADQLGQIDISRVFNRGAAWNNAGEAVWHLGDRLMVDGRTESLDYDDGNIYVSGATIDLGGDDDAPVPPKKRQEISSLLMRYRWLTPEDGRRMLGWMVTAVMGGILEWRPHLWFLGPADMGKSWFEKHIIMRLHDTLATRMAEPTEASIARQLRSSSLPLILDEAEPERRWVEGSLSLCRIAAGGDGDRARADYGGQGFTSTRPRFSALMSSTKIPHLQAADNSRFVLIRPSPKGVADWPALEADLMKTFAPPSDLPRALRRTIVQDSRKIADVASSIARELQRHGVGSREAMLRGALSAGWQWWSGSEHILGGDLSPRSADKELDAAEVLMEILGHRVRTDAGDDRSLLDLIVAGANRELYESYGVSYVHGEGLLIAPTHHGINRALARSRFSSADVTNLLLQLEGTHRAEHPRRIGSLRARPIIVSHDTCLLLGVVPEGLL